MDNWRHCSAYKSGGRHELAPVLQRDDIPEGSGPVGAHRAAGVGPLRAGGRQPGHARQEHAGQSLIIVALKGTGSRDSIQFFD
jgi:hypothetical protein